MIDHPECFDCGASFLDNMQHLNLKIHFKRMLFCTPLLALTILHKKDLSLAFLITKCIRVKIDASFLSMTVAGTEQFMPNIIRIL